MSKKIVLIIIAIIVVVGASYWVYYSKLTPKGAVEEETGEQEPLSETPDKAKFDEYFTSVSLAKLPAESEFNPFAVVKTKVFTQADQFCTSFEIKKTISSGSFGYGVLDKDSGEYARPKAVFPVELKKGGSVGCEELTYTTGKYEFKIYIDDVFTAILPFEVR